MYRVWVPKRFDLSFERKFLGLMCPEPVWCLPDPSPVPVLRPRASSGPLPSLFWASGHLLGLFWASGLSPTFSGLFGPFLEPRASGPFGGFLGLFPTFSGPLAFSRLLPSLFWPRASSGPFLGFCLFWAWGLFLVLSVFWLLFSIFSGPSLF